VRGNRNCQPPERFQRRCRECEGGLGGAKRGKAWSHFLSDATGIAGCDTCNDHEPHDVETRGREEEEEEEEGLGGLGGLGERPRRDGNNGTRSTQTKCMPHQVNVRCVIPEAVAASAKATPGTFVSLILSCPRPLARISRLLSRPDPFPTRIPMADFVDFFACCLVKGALLAPPFRSHSPSIILGPFSPDDGSRRVINST
jgi:hypothetical protein